MDVILLEFILNLFVEVKKFGVIKFLVNLVGLQIYGIVESIFEDDWDRIMNVNFKSMFLVSKQLVLVIRYNGGGGIVYISFI